MALGQVLATIKKHSPIPVAVQLAHAASTRVPWEGGKQIGPTEPTGWKTGAPSPLPYLDEYDAPTALDQAGLDRVTEAFIAATKRAARLGFDGIELHVHTDICCTSSCHLFQISAPTNMAGPLKTG